jgi:hypothetical protein
MTAMNQRSHKQRGSSLVEFAVVSVLFCAFLFGIIDWSLIMYQHAALLGRATAAARYVSTRGVGPSSAGVQAIVRCGTVGCTGYWPPLMNGATAVVTRFGVPEPGTDLNNGSAVTKDHVLVEVSGYKVVSLTPFFGFSRNVTQDSVVVRVVQPMECQTADCTVF